MKKVFISGKYLESGFVQQASVYTPLTDFIIDSGFLPIIGVFHTQFQTISSASNLAEIYLSGIDGLILQGGNDIEPNLYNQQNYHSRGITLFRDVFEYSLIKIAVEQKIPIFGICRGMQLINIIFGGTLHQDLPISEWQKHNFTADREYAAQSIIADKSKHHKVSLSTSGVLQPALQKTEIWVNSLHHQGIDVLANNLTVEALSDDRLVEAISSLENKIIGVQWHPELDPYEANYKQVFSLWLGWI